MLKANSSLRSKTALKAKTTTVLKKSKISKTPKHSISKLKKKADTVFSLATRYRFAELVDGEWLAKCVTCGVVRPIKRMQCGHFQSRRFNATRFSEENTAAQCDMCNRWNHGEQYKFALFLEDFYGQGTAKRLEQEAHQPHPFTVLELEEIIQDSLQEISWYESIDVLDLTSQPK